MAQVEKKQESPLEQASNLYSQYQNARFLGRVGQLGGRFAAQVGARAGVAAAGPLGTIGAPFWIALGVILGFTLFIVLITGQNLTGQTPTTSAGSFVPGPVRPPSGDFNTLRENLKNTETGHGIDFVGFDNPTLYYNYLAWAWEKLEEVKHTKFLELVKKGNTNTVLTITKVDRCYNLAKPPANLELSGKSCATGIPYPKELFQIVFIHELSHIIETGPNSRFDELKKILSTGQEDYLTNYSKNADKCYRTNKDDEDYAEMIAYFLNPEFPEQDLGPPDCKPSDETRTKNPYKTGRFPLHQKLAAEILGISLSPTPTPITSAVRLSCPVDGGTITYPSFQANGVTGHCGENYVSEAKKLGYSEEEYKCNTDSRRAKSVDVLTDGGPNGKEVKLPFIDGKRLSWTRIEGVLQLSRTDCFPEEMLPGFNCGVGVAFTAKDETGNSWVLQLLHMYEPSLAIEVGQSYPSGTVVGKSEAIHTHVTIGKNVAGNQAFAVAGSSDTRSGWLAPDKEMGMCQERAFR